MPFASDVSPRVARVGGLRLEARPGGHRKPCAARVARLKKGLSTTQPLRADELRVIKAWLIERAKMKPTGKAFFVSERRTALSRQRAWSAIRHYGELAGLPLPAHPHMLRHACGFALADQGADTRLIQDYLV